MLVISEANLNGFISEIAQRARSITDHNGEQIILSTMPDTQLRSAAMAALFVAVGDVVFPADRQIDLRRKERPTGLLRIQE